MTLSRFMGMAIAAVLLVVPGAQALDIDMDSSADNPLPKIDSIEGGPEGLEGYVEGIGGNIGDADAIDEFVNETEEFTGTLNIIENEGVGAAQKNLTEKNNVASSGIEAIKKRAPGHTGNLGTDREANEVFTPQGAQMEGDAGQGSGGPTLGTKDVTKDYDQLRDVAVRQSRKFLDRKVARPSAKAASVHEIINYERAQEIGFANYVKANFIMRANSGLVGYLFKLATKAPTRGVRENLQAAIYAELMRSRQIVLETAVTEARIRQAARESLFQ